MKRLKCTFEMIVVLVWLTVSGVCAAGSWCVATNGSGADGLSWSTAYTNLQDALNVALSNDTIYLAGHTFACTNTIQLTNSFFSIVGGYAGNDGLPGTLANTPTVLTRGVGNEIRIMNVVGITNAQIQSVTIAGGLTKGDPAQGGGVLISNCTDLVFSSCTVSNNEASYVSNVNASHDGGGIYSTDSSVLLTNCVVVNNRARAHNYFSKGAGIYVASGSMTVVDSIIARNQNILKYPGVPRSWGAGVYVGGKVKLHNCLIYGNDGGGLSGAGQSGLGEAVYVLSGGSLQMDFCTVAHHLWSGIYRGGGSAVVSNSIVWANGNDIGGTVTLGYSNVEDGDSAGSNGNISAAPLFDRMYYLQTNSPCINSGSTDAVSVGMNSKTTHTDGTVDTGIVDIGYHYVAGMDMSYADLYVDNGGSDGNSGTNLTLPLKTITKALSTARDGTWIHVATGQYTTSNGEMFPLTLSEKVGVQVLGTNAALTVVDAGATDRVMILNDLLGGSRIEHLTITGGYKAGPSAGPSVNGGGVEGSTCYGLVFESCIISNNVAASTYYNYGAGLYLDNSELTLSNCSLENNTIPTKGNAYGAGIYLSMGRLTVRECTIRNNVAKGQYNQSGGGMVVSSGVLSMRNTLVEGNNAKGVGDGIYMSTADTTQNSLLENCTIVTNNGQGLHLVGGSLMAKNTILWGNGDDVVGTVELRYSCIEDGDNNGVNGCTNANPEFVDFEAGNYRLSDGSPLIDAGEYEVWMEGAVDLDGNLRLVGSNVDMGAYEMPLPEPSGMVILIR